MVSRLSCIIASILVAGAAAQVPDNDVCIQRTILRPYEPVYGNLTEANFDYHNQGVCGPRSDRSGVWYEVLGRGAQVTVKVCTNNEVITDFGVILECNTQKCVGAPDQTFEPSNCDEEQYVTFSWTAEEDIQYFVHVRSDVIDGIGSNFTIVYEDDSLEGTLPPDVETDEIDKSASVNDSSGRQNAAGAIALLTVISSITSLLW